MASRSVASPPNAAFVTVVSGLTTGLVGTVNVRVEDTNNNVLTAPTTTGIIESGTGIYTKDDLVAPSTAGTYLVIWNDGSADADEPDILTVTYTINGVTGDALCTVAQVDAILNRGGTSTDYSSLSKTDAISVAQEAFEHEANVAFTPRVETFTLDGSGTVNLCLPVPRVLACSAASINDTEIDADDVDPVEHEGVLYYASGWTCGRRNVSVTVTHGWAECPADVSRAVALIAAAIVADGPWDDRGYAVTDDGGSIRLLTAGVARASFSIPEVQAALNRHRYPTVA